MSETVPGVTRLPRRDDYTPIVKAHLPCHRFADGELVIRTSLLLMRDQAMATKRYASEPSWKLLDVVERCASDAALNRRVSLDDLREFRRLCSACVTTARDFDVLYQPIASDEGEANARG